MYVMHFVGGAGGKIMICDLDWMYTLCTFYSSLVHHREMKQATLARDGPFQCTKNEWQDALYTTPSCHRCRNSKNLNEGL